MLITNYNPFIHSKCGEPIRQWAWPCTASFCLSTTGLHDKWTSLAPDCSNPRQWAWPVCAIPSACQLQVSMTNGPRSPLTVRIHDSGRGPYALVALYPFLLPFTYYFYVYCYFKCTFLSPYVKGKCSVLCFAY